MRPNKYLFLAVISMSFCVAQAEDYYSLLEKGKVWRCGYYNASDTLYTDFQLSGDTLIGGKAYLKVDNSTAILREESQRIHVIDEQQFGDKEEHLLYDFGMKVGDSYRFSESAPVYVVAKTDKIDVGGMLLKRLWFIDKNYYDQGGNAQPDYAFCWVEGIGSQKGLLHVFDGNEPIGRVPFMDCCYKNGKRIFLYENFKSLPVTDGIKPVAVPAAESQQDGGTYDLQGRRMAEGQALRTGIYVKDGRKFVVK